MLERRDTPDGRRLAVTREIPAGRERVWDLLCDTERWPDWGPSVRAVDCERRYIEEGSTGRVRVPGGLWLPFRIDTCRDYRWTWRVARVPATGHFVEPVPPGPDSGAGEADARNGGERGCRVRVGFELPVYAAFYAPVCRRALDRLAGLA
jgi:hypothetical protein